MQVRVLSLPLPKDVLPGEQSSSNLDEEGSTPSVLARVSVAEQPRHRPAASDRRVRLPPDTLTPCEEAGVHRPGCLPGIDGFDSRTGRFFGPWTERRGDRLIRGLRQVRLLPARLGNGLERLQQGFMCPSRRVRLPLPRLVLQSYPRGPAATAPLLQGGIHRRFESCRGYCGVDWSQAPARSHKPSPRRFKSGLRNFLVWKCCGRTPPW